MAGGGFFGGLAEGLDTGFKRSMDRDRMEEEKKTRALQNEALGLDIAKKREDKAAEDEIKSAGQRAYAAALPSTPTNDDEGNPMPQPAVTPYMQKLATIKALDASMGAALKTGKRDIYKQYLDDSSAMRAQMSAEALSKYKATGDINPVIDVYDNLHPDGGSIDRSTVKITPGQNGQNVITAEAVRGDKRVPIQMTDAELVDKFSALTDPKAWLNSTHAINVARENKQWEWQNDPKIKMEERKVAVEERKAKVLEDTKPADEDLKRAQAEYYRGAKTALTNAQAVKAGRGANPEEVAKAHRKVDFEIDATIGKILSTETKDDGTGKMVRVDHPLKDYRSQVSAAAVKLMQQNDYDVSPVAAIEKAITDVRGRMDTLHDNVGIAFDDALKKKSFFGGMDGALPKLRADIDGMVANGYSVDEIKKAAKAAGRDPALIDKAMKTAPANSTSAGKVAPAKPAADKSYKSLWE